jgi:hypothetical protein
VKKITVSVLLRVAEVVCLRLVPIIKSYAYILLVCPTEQCLCKGSGCTLQILKEKRSFSNPTSDMSSRDVASGSVGQCKVGACFDPSKQSASCGDNEKPVGEIKGGCDTKSHVKSICCPNSSRLSPADCRWRDGADSSGKICNGQCNGWENGWGILDKFGDSDQAWCASGQKAFCCTSPRVTKAIDGCYWSPL